jgi:hypothetical protein
MDHISLSWTKLQFLWYMGETRCLDNVMDDLVPCFWDVHISKRLQNTLLPTTDRHTGDDDQADIAKELTSDHRSFGMQVDVSSHKFGSRIGPKATGTRFLWENTPCLSHFCLFFFRPRTVKKFAKTWPLSSTQTPSNGICVCIQHRLHSYPPPTPNSLNSVVSLFKLLTISCDRKYSIQ